MHEARVAYPYAQSLYGLAKEQGATDEVVRDMAFIAELCNQNPNLVKVLKSPIIGHDQKMHIMDTLLKGRVSDLTFKIYTLLRKKNREKYLQDIAIEFATIHREDRGIVAAQVTTTFPLSDKMKADFAQLISSKFQANNIELEEVIDTTIVGGYILKVGDRQIDQSIKGKITELKSKFKVNPYISKL